MGTPSNAFASPSVQPMQNFVVYDHALGYTLQYKHDSQPGILRVSDAGWSEYYGSLPNVWVIYLSPPIRSLSTGERISLFSIIHVSHTSPFRVQLAGQEI